MNDCLPQHVQISSTPVLPKRQRLTSPLEGGNLSHLSLSVRQLWESRAYLGFGTRSDQGLKFDFVTSCDLSSLGLCCPSCKMGCSEDQNEIYEKGLSHNTQVLVDGVNGGDYQMNQKPGVGKAAD